MKPQPMHHDHNCFAEAFETFLRMRNMATGRAGFFLYVASDDTADAHFLGNTAFAAGALHRLIGDGLSGHVFGACAHCDAVAQALKDAKLAFDTSMAAHRGTSC